MLTFHMEICVSNHPKARSKPVIDSLLCSKVIISNNRERTHLEDLDRDSTT